MTLTSVQPQTLHMGEPFVLRAPPRGVLAVCNRRQKDRGRDFGQIIGNRNTLPLVFRHRVTPLTGVFCLCGPDWGIWSEVLN